MNKQERLSKAINVARLIICNLPSAVLLCSIFLLVALMNHPTEDLIKFCCNPITIIVIATSTVLGLVQLLDKSL